MRRLLRWLVRYLHQCGDAAMELSKLTFLQAWQARGRLAENQGRSLWITLSGIVAGAIVVVQLFGAQAIGGGRLEDDAGLREALLFAYKQGARPALVERRARELAALGIEEPRQAGHIVEYANALVQARGLAREGGVSYPSGDIVAAIADALMLGGSREDILWIVEKAGERRASVLSRYFVLMRRGERSGSAAAMAMRE